MIIGNWRIRRPDVWPTLMIIVMSGTMLVLGAWQLQRLEWKEGLIAQVRQGMDAAPLAILPAGEAELLALEFQPVLLTGRYDYAHELHLAARYYQGTLGYHVLTPMHLVDGRVILVDRGWVPAAMKDAVPHANEGPEGEAAVRGILRRYTGRNWITPVNDPVKNLWFARELAPMRAATGLELLPVSVDALREAVHEGFPVPEGGDIQLRNDHLGYAITWFGVGLAGIIIFLVYYAEPKARDRV